MRRGAARQTGEFKQPCEDHGDERLWGEKKEKAEVARIDDPHKGGGGMVPEEKKDSKGL